MTTYDVAPDDEPLDMTAVTADDALVERLRDALSPEDAVVWDDDDEMDPGYALLRALQIDVSDGLDDATPILVPAVTPLAARRRHLGRGATLAVVAAGVLSVGGVAAASAPGQPLSGARSAVANAVANVVDAITPSKPVGPEVVEPATVASANAPAAVPAPEPTATPPGQAVRAAARNASAIAQINGNLDRAAAFIDAGKLAPAKQQLDAAERKLGYVSDQDARSTLAGLIADLRAKLATKSSAAPAHGRPAAGHSKAQPSPSSGKGTGKSTGPATSVPHSRQSVVPTHDTHNNGQQRSLDVRHVSTPAGSGKGQAGARD